MREKRFVAARRARWDQLEALIGRVDGGGIGRLDPSQVDALAFGYRAVTSDLAMARGRGYDPAIVGYLDRLAARAHAYVYLGTSRSGWSGVVRFFARTFPCEVRRSWLPIGICVAITVLSAIVAYGAVTANSANAYALLPPSEVPLINRSLHDSNFGFDRAFAPAMSSLIITNNIKVAAIAAAGGVSAGLLTVWIILQNGLMVGGLGALFAHAGYGLDFWATISPHGVIELTAIQIAGGAGLLIATGIVAPGRLRRGDALARYGRRAGTLVAGTAGMLVVAGLIEGFISPQRLDAPIRIAIGAVTGVALAAYLGLAGSEQRARLQVDVGVEQREAEFGGRDVDDADAAFA